MTIKSAVKAASLLAAVILAVPAFAGTATYLGTHTASDVQIDGTATFDAGIVSYSGGLIRAESSTTAWSGMQLPDSSNNPVTSTGSGTFTAVIQSVNLNTMGDADHLGFYYDQDIFSDSQVLFGITTDNAGGFTASMGLGQGNSLVDLNPGNIIRAPITLPATVVLTRAGFSITATVNGNFFGTAAIASSTEPLWARVFDSGGGNGQIRFSSLVVTGVGIPDINFNPGPTDIVYVDFANTGSENGSQGTPWNTLADALAVVDVGGTIRINGSSSDVTSDETFTGGSVINQDVTIQASPAGASGVSIGASARSAGEAPRSGFVSRDRD